MKAQEDNQSEIEVTLQRFGLKEPAPGHRDRILAAAQATWQDSTTQPAFNPLPFIKALAACVAVVLAVEAFGRVALTPWKPHPTFPPVAQDTVALEDVHILVPSVKLHGSLSSMTAQRKSGKGHYRDQLNGLLNETPQRPPSKPAFPTRRQGRHVPGSPGSWHT